MADEVYAELGDAAVGLPGRQRVRSRSGGRVARRAGVWAAAASLVCRNAVA